MFVRLTLPLLLPGLLPGLDPKAPNLPLPLFEETTLNLLGLVEKVGVEEPEPFKELEFEDRFLLNFDDEDCKFNEEEERDF